MDNALYTEGDYTDHDLLFFCGPDLEFDYLSQLYAMHSLLSVHTHSEVQRTNEIKRVEEIASTSTGEANQRTVDHFVESLHYSTYHDVAQSMAAVGLLAPFIESIFRAVWRKMDHKPPQGNLVANIMKFIDSGSHDLKQYMPADLEVTLEALFLYRNKLFHLGFEWRDEECQKFDKHVLEWPCGWFGRLTSGGRPKMFYMSSEFTRHCIDTAKNVLKGLARHELDKPTTG